MSREKRLTPRFRDFAKARVDELCQLPGYLEDISRTGCKVRFPHTFPVDAEREYTLTVLPAGKSGLKEFDLTVKPEWISPDAEPFEVGFSVLCSPGLHQLRKYVEMLAALDEQDICEA